MKLVLLLPDLAALIQVALCVGRNSLFPGFNYYHYIYYKVNCNLVIFIAVSAALIGCRISNGKKAAIQVANQAMKTYSQNASNMDSGKRALYLLDSAIKLCQIPDFYLFKYQIYRSMKNGSAALYACDSVLMIDRNNFGGTLEKGIAFEGLGRLDSAFCYYQLALRLIDDPQSFNANGITKDHEKIVITALLKDTASFNKLVNAFRVEYAHSKDNNFELFDEEFHNFKRENYLN